MGRQLGWVWFGGRDTIAILYSVLVGDTREFWVKTEQSDVKVAEIPGTFDPEEVNPTSIGGQGSSMTLSGSLGPISGIAPGQQSVPNGRVYSIFNGSEIRAKGSAFLGGGWVIDLTGTITWTGQNTGQGASFQALAYNFLGSSVDPGVGVRMGWGNVVVGGPNVVFGSPRTVTGRGVGIASLFTAMCGGYTELELTLQGPGVASVDYTATATVREWAGLTSYPYAARLSSDEDGNIFVIVKWFDFDFDCADLSESSDFPPDSIYVDSQFNRNETIHLKLVNGKTGDSVDYHYRDKASVVKRQNNWRKDQEDFVYPIPAATAVAQDNEVNVKGEDLYRINLNQFISGQTLKNRLQASTDLVNASMSVTTPTTVRTETVEVYGPGRGNIEGIIYI
jgi:hypothetical protein